MKIFKRLFPLAAAFIIIAIAAVCVCFNGNNTKAYAAESSEYYYGFDYTAFHVTYDIRTDRTMDVTYDLGVHYYGTRSTGVMFDIPVDSGDRIRNITAYELTGINGNEFALDYKVTNETFDLVTVDMGDTTLKRNQTHYYRINFEYAITRPAANEKNCILLNAIGFGHTADMSDVQVTLNMPDGFLGSQTKCYMGVMKQDDTDSEKDRFYDFTVSGNTVSLTLESMRPEHGITFDLPFEEGVLTVKPDITPYWIVIGACAVLALLFAAKLLAFNKDGLTPVTNVEAPDEMDPLVMGKLIDNKVNKSDVTSLIYYWANKGYINIDLSNENDIKLIRIYKCLPVNAPNHQKRMYSALFGNRDIVNINSLAYKFYSTVEGVTREVNSESGRLYDGKSMGFAVLFALVGALIMAVTPIVLAFITISHKMFTIMPLFMIIPAFIIFALMQTVRQNRLKFKKNKLALMYAGIVLLAAVFSGIYVLFVPSFIIEILPKFLLCAVGFAVVIISTLIISRSPAYVEKLNKIVGFRDFILNTEKEKLEMMLADNPELYYKVLPYAIVLGVSDIWENKFAALTVAPPSWCTNRYHRNAFNIMMFSAVMRRANQHMTNTFVSRPASASSGSFSGGHGGGSFGGHSGGGHGGGGSRGR